MPTEILDGYLGTLTKAERSLLREVIEPFLYTAGELAEQALRDEAKITKEVDLGPVVLVASGITEAEVKEAERHIRKHEDGIITAIANQEFEKEFLAKPTTCILPTIALLQKLRLEYPIFALLIAYHDNVCKACGVNSEEEFEEREEEAANFVACLSPEDQHFLVTQGKQFRASMGDLLPSIRLEILNPEVPIFARLCEDVCMFSLGFTSEYLAWASRYPRFLWNPAIHGESCPQTRKKVSVFEKVQVEGLPGDIRSIYEEQAFILTKGSGHRLFE